MATVLYYLHVGCVMATSLGFIVRWMLSLKSSSLLQRPLLRLLPHVIDTVLLLSGLGMLWIYGLNPITTPWLLAKLLALLGYILFGYVALKLRFSFVLRLVSGVLALGLLAYIVAVARTAQVIPWLVV